MTERTCRCGAVFTPAKAHHRLCRHCFQAALDDPDQHYESEWRTVSFKLPAPSYWLWKRLVHRGYYMAGKSHPSMEDVVDYIWGEISQIDLQQPANGIDPHRWFNAVHDGEIKCLKCGSLNAQNLTWHHTTPRSHQGHESVQVALCMFPCHDEVQKDWPYWLAKWEAEGLL